MTDRETLRALAEKAENVTDEWDVLWALEGRIADACGTRFFDDTGPPNLGMQAPKVLRSVDAALALMERLPKRFELEMVFKVSGEETYHCIINEWIRSTPGALEAFRHEGRAPTMAAAICAAALRAIAEEMK